MIITVSYPYVLTSEVLGWKRTSDLLTSDFNVRREFSDPQRDTAMETRTDSKANNILRLEEEIFLYEISIESLNKRLHLVKQQLAEEEEKLVDHRRREAELNSQCFVLRTSLEEQTRLWRNLEGSLNRGLTRLQRKEVPTSTGINELQQIDEVIAGTEINQSLDSRFHDTQMLVAEVQKSTESLITADNLIQIDHKNINSNSSQEQNLNFTHMRARIPSLWDSPEWIQAMWSQSKRISLQDSWTDSPVHSNESNIVQGGQEWVRFPGSKWWWDRNSLSSTSIPSLYPPIKAKGQLLFNLIIMNQAEVIMQRHSILMSMNGPTRRNRVAENDEAKETVDTSRDILLYKTSVWDEIQYSCLDLHFQCLHDPFLQYSNFYLQTKQSANIETEGGLLESKSGEDNVPLNVSTKTLDPHTIICPYELMGTCADTACPYQHLNKRDYGSRRHSSRYEVKLPVIKLPPLKLSRSDSVYHQSREKDDQLPEATTFLTANKTIHRVESPIHNLESDYIPLPSDNSTESSMGSDLHVADAMRPEDMHSTQTLHYSLPSKAAHQAVLSDPFKTPWYVNKRILQHNSARNEHEWGFDDALGLLGFEIFKEGKITYIRYRCVPSRTKDIHNKCYLRSLLSSKRSLPFANKIELHRALYRFGFVLAFTDATQLTIHSGRFDIFLALIELKNSIFSDIESTKPNLQAGDLNPSKNADVKRNRKRGRKSTTPHSMSPLLLSHFNFLQLISEIVEGSGYSAFCGCASASIYGGFQSQLILMVQASFLHNYFLLIRQFNKKASQLILKKGRRRKDIFNTISSQLVRCIQNHYSRLTSFVKELSCIWEAPETVFSVGSQRDVVGDLPCLSLNSFIPCIGKERPNIKPWHTSSTRRMDKILECFYLGRRFAAYITKYLNENLVGATDIYLFAENIFTQLVHVIDCFILEIKSYAGLIHDHIKTVMCLTLFCPVILASLSFFTLSMEHERVLDINKDTPDDWQVFHRYNKRTNGTMTFIYKSFTAIVSKLDTSFVDQPVFIYCHFKALSVCILVNLAMVSDAQNILVHTLVDQRDQYSWCCSSHSELLWSQLIYLHMSYPSDLPKIPRIETVSHFRRVKRLQQKNRDIRSIIGILSSLGVDLFNFRLQGDHNLVPMKISSAKNIKNVIYFSASKTSQNFALHNDDQRLVYRITDLIKQIVCDVVVDENTTHHPFHAFPRSLLMLGGAIEKLNLSSNKLKRLPLTLGFRLSSLKILDVSENELSALPQICSLLLLESLNISGNRFDSIPPGLGKLKHLSTFSASNNLIRRISDELLKCSKLVTLDLRNNKINEIPSTLSLKLTKLSMLLLDGNVELLRSAV